MKNNRANKSILFVGSFKSHAKDGSVGGQMYACNSLINSKLSEQIDWILLDTTSDSNKTTSFYRRVYKAVLRINHFLFYLIFKKLDTVIIFTADGFSFIEKGTMAFLAKSFNKKTILAPRSGIIVNDIKSSSFMRWFIPLVLKKVDYVICQSQVWKVFFQKLYTKMNDHYVIINNWIDIAKYNQKINATTEEDPIRILFMAWVDKNKGIFDLLQAAKEILKENDNVFFEIAGDGSAMEESKLFVDHHHLSSNITFRGWVKGDDKIKLLNYVDIYVLPSYYEGYPNSLMEAMACGKACIATNVGSIPDLITNYENGLIFTSGNVNELIYLINEVIHNSYLRNKIGLNAQKSIKQNNSLETAIFQFQKILLT